MKTDQECAEKAKAAGYSAKEGLLYREKQLVTLPTADYVAAEYGFMCAERLVKALEALK